MSPKKKAESGRTRATQDGTQHGVEGHERRSGTKSCDNQRIWPARLHHQPLIDDCETASRKAEAQVGGRLHGTKDEPRVRKGGGEVENAQNGPTTHAQHGDAVERLAEKRSQAVAATHGDLFGTRAGSFEAPEGSFAELRRKDHEHIRLFGKAASEETVAGADIGEDASIGKKIDSCGEPRRERHLGASLCMRFGPPPQDTGRTAKGGFKLAQLTESFQHFEKELEQKLDVANKMGLSKEHIDLSAKRIADWLLKETEPQSPEQVLLKQMWQSATDDERHAMSSVLHKMIERTVH